MTKDNKQKKISFLRKETWIVIFGIFIAFFGIASPFYIFYRIGKPYKITSFQEIGVVGDFFGGTSVGLLSFASMIFVFAAIVMQKEELSLQREEVEKTRKEFEITNETMKKQQFDSTFFNMINLHHNILNEIKLEDLSGRAVIQKLYQDLIVNYGNEAYKKHMVNLLNGLHNENIDYINSLTDILYKVDLKEKYIRDYIDYYTPPYNEELEDYDFSEYNRFVETVENDTNPHWLKFYNAEKNDYYNVNIKNNKKNSLKFLNELNFKHYFDKEYKIDHEFFYKFIDSFYENPLQILKFNTCEELYKKYENLIGHYYRNLYRIIKLIQNHTFSDNEAINNEEKRQYRGILRAQLSSYELLMIFYNVIYSNKGEKFKNLLQDTNFFDDHLIEEDFIWKNDKRELKKLN